MSGRVPQFADRYRPHGMVPSRTWKGDPAVKIWKPRLSQPASLPFSKSFSSCNWSTNPPPFFGECSKQHLQHTNTHLGHRLPHQYIERHEHTRNSNPWRLALSDAGSLPKHARQARLQRHQPPPLPSPSPLTASITDAHYAAAPEAR